MLPDMKRSGSSRRRRGSTGEIPLSELKARCSEIVDGVARGGREVVITRRGEPVARLVPAEPARRSPRGSWRGLVRITGEVVHADWSDEFEVLGD
jgi:prevent-host-death family protein